MVERSSLSGVLGPGPLWDQTQLSGRTTVVSWVYLVSVYLSQRDVALSLIPKVFTRLHRFKAAYGGPSERSWEAASTEDVSVKVRMDRPYHFIQY